jgi:hypothetical protein
MVHGILQFTPSIAFRYVLHRCKSLDIRCRESLLLPRGEDSRTVVRNPPPPFRMFLGAFRAGVGLFRRRPPGAVERARPPPGCGDNGAEPVESDGL